MKTKSKPIVVTAESSHCRELAPNIRDIDSLEMHATNVMDLSNEELLMVYLGLSDESYAVTCKGKTLAIYGVRRKENIVIPWMIMSEEFINKHSRIFLRECKKHLNKMIGDTPYSFNFVSVNNTKSHRWLEWLGFTVHKDKDMYVRGVHFCLFDKGIREQCVI